MKTLQVGDQLPYFSTTDEEGNKIESTDMLGSKSVIFFYPKANTPGCTAEACNLRDHYVLLKEKGYRLYGVSADGQQKQKNFKDKFNFPFPLLADEDKAVIDAFGVWGPKKFMGKEYDGIHRMTFIVDETGKVQRVISKVKTKDHAAQILEED
ncbi:MAG: thioredoxin-dependent thiol peroxidase [Flavobacteriia bacterium]|jgi:peroxiredoxin Q/BCP|nr:thioredoxin-dependent thiol peroxidase [Flavobacteriia bacterium]